MAAKMSFKRKLLRTVMKSHKFSLPVGYELPIRMRPYFVGLTAVVLLLLAFLGFSDTAKDWPVNDKVLHFVCMGLATAIFYWIIDVDEEARRIFFWRYFGLGFSGVVCLFLGGIVSEFVQSLIPSKTFQWGDVVANLLGSSLGLALSFRLEKYYRYRREVARLYQPLGEAVSDSESESELLPTHSASKVKTPKTPSNHPRSAPRIGNVWDSREDFGLGSDSGSESDGERADIRTKNPVQIVVSEST